MHDLSENVPNSNYSQPVRNVSSNRIMPPSDVPIITPRNNTEPAPRGYLSSFIQSSLNAASEASQRFTSNSRANRDSNNRGKYLSIHPTNLKCFQNMAN